MRLTGNSVVCERCGSRIVEQDWGNGGRVWADQSDGRAHSDVRCLTGRVLSLESEIARLREKIDREESEHAQTICERDMRETQLEEAHAAMGCEREASNLHDYGACILANIDACVAQAERSQTAEAENARLRAEGEEMDAYWHAEVAKLTAERDHWKQARESAMVAGEMLTAENARLKSR